MFLNAQVVIVEPPSFGETQATRPSVHFDAGDVGVQAGVDARREARADVAADHRVGDEHQRRTGGARDALERIDERIDPGLAPAPRRRARGCGRPDRP